MNPRHTYYGNGKPRYESWWTNKKRHRFDGPAWLSWNENGQLQREEWYIANKFHRVDGPALQQWDENGKLLTKEWYIEGNRVKPISDPLEWALFIAKNFGNVPGLEKFCLDNIEEKKSRAIIASSRLL